MKFKELHNKIKNNHALMMVLCCGIPLLLLFAQYASAHTDEIGEVDSMHFMHYGSLTFPVWTYWVEILEHSGMIVVGIIILIILFNHYSSSANKTKRKNIAYALWGFGLWTLGEILTQSHHFLFFPFGIFNAVVTHGLTLAGIILITISIAKIIIISGFNGK